MEVFLAIAVLLGSHSILTPHWCPKRPHSTTVFQGCGLVIGWLFVLFSYFVVAGSSNAVNLTDGLDGLAILPTVMVATGLGVIAYLTGHIEFADYFNIAYLPGTGELVVFCGAIAGAALILWFNTYPAMIFMGDVGALALGAALGVVAVMTRHEIVLFIMGGIFVLETVSVIIQVTSFKLTGNRVFRMAPIHHHFELKVGQSRASLSVSGSLPRCWCSSSRDAKLR